MSVGKRIRLFDVLFYSRSASIVSIVLNLFSMYDVRQIEYEK